MCSQLIVNISVSYNKLFLHAWKIVKKTLRNTYGRISIIGCFHFALKTTSNIQLRQHSKCVYMYTHIYKVHFHAHYIKITMRNINLSVSTDIYPMNSLQRRGKDQRNSKVISKAHSLKRFDFFFFACLKFFW